MLQNSEIKQKNEGGWEFYWDEESRKGFVILEVKVQRFLDSSLIDVDVHPGYVSVVIKSKVFSATTLNRKIEPNIAFVNLIVFHAIFDTGPSTAFTGRSAGRRQQMPALKDDRKPTRHHAQGRQTYNH